MKLNLHLLSLITFFCIVTSSFVYKKENDAADSRHHLYRVPKETYLLRMGPDIEDLDIKPVTIKPEFYETRKRHHKRHKKVKPSKKIPARKDPIDWGGSEKLSLDDVNPDDAKKAAGKVKILQKAKAREATVNKGRGFIFPRPDEANGVSMYHLDPVLNILRSGPFRRQESNSESSSDMSSEENENWKQEWQRNWLMKKYEAVKAPRPQGDQVNIVAARPWGMSCGDTKQHDMPWGSCTLAMECEAEYRIYRGDIFCGRTEFVCCAIQLSNYDMNLAIDPSFEDQSMSTDSEEKKKGDKGGDERQKKRKEKSKKKRQEDRDRRKKKLRRIIDKTVKEIKKILNRAYSNGTRERQRKTKMLKKFVRNLKKQYKKDRLSIKELHAEQILKIDTALMHKLNQVRAVNENFMLNQTFANIVINGTISEKGARMLVEAYPDLTSYFKFRRFMWNDEGESRDYLDDDVEYGFLNND